MNALFIGPGVSSTGMLTETMEVVMLPSLETSKCKIPSPFHTYISDYSMMTDKRGIDICGGMIGRRGIGQSSDCFRLPFNSKTWLQSPTIPSLTRGRKSAASAFIKGKWWIAGGYDFDERAYLWTSEVRGDDDRWSPVVDLPSKMRQSLVVDLPSKMRQHCMVNIDENRVLLTGGFDGNYLSSTYLYDARTNKWEKKKSFSTKRRAHSCALIEKNKVMIVAGYNGRYISSSEIYSMETNTWQKGPSLPKGTYDAQMVTVHGRTYHMGGIGLKTDSFRLHKVNSFTLAWKKVGDLRVGKSDFKVVPIKFSSKTCNGWE